MALLTIAGNTLVLLAVFMSRSLRSSTHYLIVNLAVADLLLGIAVLPFSIVLEVSGSWMFGAIFCDVWAAVDVLCCTASIWSLCVISIDRYVGVTRPLGYNAIVTKRRVGVLMAGVWALSVAVSIVPISTDTRMGATVAVHTGRMAKFHRQQKAAKTLGIVVGVFLLCWFPFFFTLPLGE
ncbi:hypothetical protein HAZT_HAZT007801 [Hyalella azteca]|uniref:G-protein coupled receptors family 1 profile domain-containing protein n=1 Tax=Hyalella azteca TaxID=294128 RepID=A0A6A0GYD3_HYAAZ|nr:hypothetical protein HAZT_HAZT007801 [Hyalella azteca]